MPHRGAKVVGTAAVALGLVGAVTALSASSDEAINPAAEAVADLPGVTQFSFDADGDGCVFDPDRGGLVYEDLTIRSRSSGVLRISFYARQS